MPIMPKKRIIGPIPIADPIIGTSLPPTMFYILVIHKFVFIGSECNSHINTTCKCSGFQRLDNHLTRVLFINPFPNVSTLSLVPRPHPLMRKGVW